MIPEYRAALIRLKEAYPRMNPEQKARADEIIRRASLPKPPLFSEFRNKYLISPRYAPPNLFHKYAEAELDTLYDRRGSKYAWLAPRGSAKTMVVTEDYSVYCAVHGLEKVILIISKIEGQTKLIIGNIADKLSALAEAGHSTATVTKSTAMEVRLSNGVRIIGASLGMSIRGMRIGEIRPSLIIIDDPQETEQITSEAERQAHWLWFTSTVLHIGETDKSSNFIVLGTAIHEDAIVYKAYQMPGWSRKIFKAIEIWPDKMEHWKIWKEIVMDYSRENKDELAEAYYQKNKPAMDAGAMVIWPEHEPLIELMKLWAADEASFDREKQNSPFDKRILVFDPLWFNDKYIWFDKWPETTPITAFGVDPSTGKSDKTGDYPAFVWGRRGQDKVIYIDAVIERMTDVEIMDKFIEIYLANDPHITYFEGHSFQHMYITAIHERAQKRGIRQLKVLPDLDKRPKIERIRTLAPYLSGGLFRFKRGSPGAQLLVDQMKKLPHKLGQSGLHDDGPDALEKMLRGMIQLWNKMHGK